MSIFEAIVNHFNAQLDATSGTIELLTPYIAEAVHLFIENLEDDKKIICCTSSSTEALGRHFCNQLMHSPRLDRPALPALFLTPDSDAYDEHHISNNIYTKQIQAFACTGDVLFLLSSSGSEKNLANAIDAAITKKMHVIACIGGTHTELAQKIPASEVNIPIQGLPASQTLCIQFLLTQMLSELIEQQLFGSLD